MTFNEGKGVKGVAHANIYDTHSTLFLKKKNFCLALYLEMSHQSHDFCFLFVGHWLKGDIGQDRKDVGMMIKTFCETFKRKSPRNRPGLILKTSHAHFSIIDRDVILDKIQSIIAPYGNNIPNTMEFIIVKRVRA